MSPAVRWLTSWMVVDGSDSDGDSDVEMDDEAADPEINFTDIAERPSAVHCQVAPTRMLQQANNWISKDGKKLEYGSPIEKTIIQDDMEGFVQMCNLYNFVGHDLLADDLVPTIMSNDRPEVLDEMIRRTGCGITAVLDAQLKADPAAPAAKDTEETIYLGLNVGGKKRRDLVTRGMPQKNASRSHELLVEAAKAGALNAMDYLSGPRVLAAYKFYAASNSSERALYLRREQDLAGVLPKWIGWQLNPLNESCLTAAIIANKLDFIKKLFDLEPNLMMEAMNARSVSSSHAGAVTCLMHVHQSGSSLLALTPCSSRCMCPAIQPSSTSSLKRVAIPQSAITEGTLIHYYLRSARD